MQMYTRDHIEKLGLSDPIVRAHLDAQRYVRGITWEQMMLSLVVSLVEAKDAMTATAIDLQRRMPPAPYLLRPNDQGKGRE